MSGLGRPAATADLEFIDRQLSNMHVAGLQFAEHGLAHHQATDGDRPDRDDANRDRADGQRAQYKARHRNGSHRDRTDRPGPAEIATEMGIERTTRRTDQISHLQLLMSGRPQRTGPTASGELLSSGGRSICKPHRDANLHRRCNQASERNAANEGGSGGDYPGRRSCVTRTAAP